MATQATEKRDFTLSVRLRPDMRERLYSVADGLGVSPATVASIAIGQYVANAQASANATTKAIEGMMASMAPQMAEMFSALTTESEPPCSSSKDSSAQLPLLAAEPTEKPAKSSQSGKSSKSKPSTLAVSSKSKPSPSQISRSTSPKSAKK